MKKRSRRNRPLSGNVTRIGGRLAAAVAVASLVGGGVLVGTESAAVAGTSGQEIEFDTYTVNSADALSHVEIAGYNQNGNWAVWKGTSSLAVARVSGSRGPLDTPKCLFCKG